MRRHHLAAAMAAALALGLTWSGAAHGAAATAAPAGGPVPQPPTPRLAWVGDVLKPVTARQAPRPSARARTVLQPKAPLGQGAAGVLITRSVVNEGRRWVEVLLPIRPNGARGWVPADVLRMRTTPLRVVIDVGARRLTVFRSNRAIMRAPVAVGKPGTETPLSRAFAIAELIPTRNPGDFLGPIVLPITGYSERLNEFDGGNGRVAIHGTSLPGLIGSAVSNGCIRMFNRDVVRLARLVQPGTPLAIRS
jgi:lipoprotein-anchoring transpeptidase ErfK/SrfK